MANVFETTPQVVGGAFTAENCTLNLGIGGKAIVQRVNFSIERPINFVYEIASAAPAAGVGQNVYYIGGRRRGQATFERIVGGSSTFKAFIDGYGPLCSTAGSSNIVLTANGGCNIGTNPLSAAAAAYGTGGPIAAGAAAAAAFFERSKTIKYTLVTPKITALGANVSAQDIIIMETVTMAFLDLDYSEI